MSKETRKMMKQKLTDIFEAESKRETYSRDKGYTDNANNVTQRLMELAETYALLDSIDEQVTRAEYRTVKRPKNTK